MCWIQVLVWTYVLVQFSLTQMMDVQGLQHILSSTHVLPSSSSSYLSLVQDTEVNGYFL